MSITNEVDRITEILENSIIVVFDSVLRTTLYALPQPEVAR